MRRHRLAAAPSRDCSSQATRHPVAKRASPFDAGKTLLWLEQLVLVCFGRLSCKTSARPAHLAESCSTLRLDYALTPCAAGFACCMNTNLQAPGAAGHCFPEGCSETPVAVSARRPRMSAARQASQMRPDLPLSEVSRFDKRKTRNGNTRNLKPRHKCQCQHSHVRCCVRASNRRPSTCL